MSLYQNAPGRLAHVDNLPGAWEIKFAERAGFRSCEDALLVESRGVAVVACDPGRERWNTVMGVFVPGPEPLPGATLYVYDYANAAGAEDEVLTPVEIVGFLGGNDLHTLGMAFDEATSTLLLTNHAEAGPRLEIFKLDFDDLDTAATDADDDASPKPKPKPKATHVRTVTHPLLHAPNSIAIVEGSGGEEFLVTNDHAVPARVNKLAALLETYLAPPTGTVVHVDLRGGDEEVKASVLARVPFANGVEFLNNTALAVSSTSRSAVYLYAVTRAATTSTETDDAEGATTTANPAPLALTYASRIRVPFFPDNLSLTRYKKASEGDEKPETQTQTKLLIAGHPHAPTLSVFAASRHVCNDARALEAADAETRAQCAEAAAAPSWVSEWSEADGLKTLYVGTEYPSSATAARDGERSVGIVAGLYAKGLLVWRE